jgi:group I intron endonuclease
MKSGIYLLTFNPDIGTYVGSAVDLEKRKADHIEAVKRKRGSPGMGRKYQAALQSCASPESLLFEVLERCEPSQLSDREKYWIDSTLPTLNGHWRAYNTVRGCRKVVSISINQELIEKVKKMSADQSLPHRSFSSIVAEGLHLWVAKYSTAKSKPRRP